MSEVTYLLRWPFIATDARLIRLTRSYLTAHCNLERAAPLV